MSLIAEDGQARKRKKEHTAHLILPCSRFIAEYRRSATWGDTLRKYIIEGNNSRGYRIYELNTSQRRYNLSKTFKHHDVIRSDREILKHAGLPYLKKNTQVRYTEAIGECHVM